MEHTISVNLETEIYHINNLSMMQWSPNKNSRHQSSGDLPWMAVLRVYCHTLIPGGYHTLRTMAAFAFGTLADLPYASLPFVDLNMYFFSVINHNYEYDSFSEFCGSFSWIIAPEGVLRTPPHHHRLTGGVRNVEECALKLCSLLNSCNQRQKRDSLELPWLILTCFGKKYYNAKINICFSISEVSLKSFFKTTWGIN